MIYILLLIFVILLVLLREKLLSALMLSFCIYTILPYQVSWSSFDALSVFGLLLLYTPLFAWMLWYYYRSSFTIPLNSDLSVGQISYLQSGKFEREELIAVLEELKRKGIVDIEREPSQRRLDRLRAKLGLSSEENEIITVCKKDLQKDMTEDELMVCCMLFGTGQLSFQLPCDYEYLDKDARERKALYKKTCNRLSLILSRSCGKYLLGQRAGYIGVAIMEILALKGMVYALAQNFPVFGIMEFVILFLGVQYLLCITFQRCGSIHATSARFQNLPELNLRWLFALTFAAGFAGMPFAEIMWLNPAAGIGMILYIAALLVIPVVAQAPCLRKERINETD